MPPAALPGDQILKIWTNGWGFELNIKFDEIGYYKGFMMQFQGSGKVYTYSYMYSNASAILKERSLTKIGKGIAIITFSSFMLESYFNHICQLIFNVNKRIEESKDSLSHEDFERMKNYDCSLSFDEKISRLKGFSDEFNKLKNYLKTTIRGNIDFFEDNFSMHPGSICDFEKFDKKYRFSPPNKYKAILASLFDKQYLFVNDEVDKIFNIRNSLAHGRTQNVAGAVELDSQLMSNWQHDCSQSNYESIFKLSENIIRTIDHRINSSITLGDLQHEIGTIICVYPNRDEDV